MEVDEKEDNKQSIFNSGPDATSSLLASFGCLQTVDKTELIAEFQRLSSTSSEGTNPSSFHNTTNQESSQTGDHSNKSVEIIDEQTATFFLEMSRWNVSTALNAYFDCGGHKSCTSPSSLLPFLKLPEMCFVGDLTSESPFGTSTATTLMTCSVEELPDDSMTQRSITHSEVELGHEFLKVWRIRNSGSETWPPGIVLRPMHINDDPLVQAQYSCISNPSTDSIPLLNIPVKSLSPNEECDVEVRLKAPSIFETPKTFESPWRTSTSQGLMFGDTIWLILNVIVSSSSLQNQSEAFSTRTRNDSDSVTTTEAAFPSVPPSSPAAVAATTTHHPLTLSSTVVSQFPTFSTSTTCEVLDPEVTQTSVCEEAKSVILTELRDHGGLEESDETTENEMN